MTFRALSGLLVATLLSSAVPAPAAEPAFDLDQRLSSVVAVEATVPGDARTARALGTERGGNGIVIDKDGLVVTIGYVVLEAYAVVVETHDGRRLPAEILAYHHETGFGLVRPILPLNLPAMPLGRSERTQPGDPVLIAAAGGRQHALPGRVMERREFAGYWEYLLDEALFAAPPHPNWGGAALIDRNGELVGLGSLFVPDARAGDMPVPGNMFVPIDLLRPLLDELAAEGELSRPRRPWLGIYSAEANGRVVVTRLADGGPADAAGVRPGDEVAAVADVAVSSVADMYRAIWRLGMAGVDVPLTLRREGVERRLSVQSADRYDYLKLDPTF